MKRLASAVLAVVLLSGCGQGGGLPVTHEIENTILMRTLGVDAEADSRDGVAVTASSGARPSAGTQQGEAPTVLAAQANTISAACQRMQAYGDRFVFYGDVEQLLIGQGQAQRGLDAVLNHVARDPELRLEAQVWAVRGGTAADVLFTAAEGEGRGAPDRLEAMREDAGLFSASVPKTAREALVEVTRNGCTFVPALTLAQKKLGDGAEGRAALANAGYAIFQNGALVAWTDSEASRGINLLLGKVDMDILELTTPDGSPIALKITGAKTKYRPVIEDGALKSMGISCKVEADVAERGGQCVLDEALLRWLEARLSETTAARMQAALAVGQGIGADYLSLKSQAALAAPWHKAVIEAQWGGSFAALPVQVMVEANIARA